MVVAINQPQGAFDRKGREQSDLDKVFKALQIANAGMGIAVNFEKYQAVDRDTAAAESLAQTKKEEFELKRLKQKEASQLEKDKFAFEKSQAAATSAEQAAVQKKQAALIAGSSPQMATVLKTVPKEFQKDAIKELGFREGLKNSVETIGGTFDTFAKTGPVEGRLPFTDKKAAVDAGHSQIMAVLVDAWKGPMGESDKKELIGFMPDIDDTKSQTMVKKAAMLDMLYANQKPTPILSGLGIKADPVDVPGLNPDLSNEKFPEFDKSAQTRLLKTGDADSTRANVEFAKKQFPGLKESDQVRLLRIATQNRAGGKK